MIVIGLTGGIASGKSTVARLLEKRGALVIDADRIGHEVLAPGGPAFEAVVERFGEEILDAGGRVDRAKLGALVFSDPDARRDLEAITHPVIYAEIVRRLDEVRRSDRVVVLDAPLLVETLPDRGRSLGLLALVVVAADVGDQVTRLIGDRGMTGEGARARIGAQAPPERKLAAADYVIDNRGSVEDLEWGVELLWNDLVARFPPGRVVESH